MSQTNSQPLSLADGLQPQNLANPYPLYEQLRESGPVYWDERVGGWTVTGYAEVAALLRDGRLSASRFMIDTSWIPEGAREYLEPTARALSRQMLFRDPPDHTRLRMLVAKAFTPRMVEQLRPTITQIANELLDKAEGSGQMELMREFAYPLPAIVIATMLGVPPEDRDQFNRWSQHFGSLLDGGDYTMEGLFEAMVGVTEFIAYFRDMIHKRRTTPKDDLMQALIDAEERGDALNEDELLGNCVLLLAAGHGTTMHLIGNGTLALLRNPEQRNLLQKHLDDPAFLSLAVAELLRYESPVQMTSRNARESLEIGGKQVQAGQEVILCLGAANRDPAQFHDPDRLNLGRPENKHLAFGLGIHFCLGAPLARLEGEIAFSTLFRRFPHLRLATEEVEWLQSLVFRGLKELPVALA
ncbi:MAG TPA: cytochrome P450 [Ktedonobacteraceae bacterium]|jgi:cytochrome P450|nr:cytochrome P450 [Ktedonobacteraceae bacterium]